MQTHYLLIGTFGHAILPIRYRVRQCLTVEHLDKSAADRALILGDEIGKVEQGILDTLITGKHIESSQAAEFHWHAISLTPLSSGADIV